MSLHAKYDFDILQALCPVFALGTAIVTEKLIMFRNQQYLFTEVRIYPASVYKRIMLGSSSGQKWRRASILSTWYSYQEENCLVISQLGRNSVKWLLLRFGTYAKAQIAIIQRIQLISREEYKPIARSYRCPYTEYTPSNSIVPLGISDCSDTGVLWTYHGPVLCVIQYRVLLYMVPQCLQES